MPYFLSLNNSYLSVSIFSFSYSHTIIPSSFNKLYSYILCRHSFIKFNLYGGSKNIISNFILLFLSNSKELQEEYKPEYYLARDGIFAISRCLGYLILLIICLTVGMDYINYILIIPGLALLGECVLISKLSKENL